MVWGAIRCELVLEDLGVNAEKSQYGLVIASTVPHGTQTWSMKSAERRKKST